MKEGRKKGRKKIYSYRYIYKVKGQLVDTQLSFFKTISSGFRISKVVGEGEVGLDTIAASSYVLTGLPGMQSGMFSSRRNQGWGGEAIPASEE